MKRQFASSLVTVLVAAALSAAPALGEPERKTDLVELDGKSVDRMQLRYDFNAAWVIDNQNLLYRDNSRDYYLVTLKEACEPLDIRSMAFNFHPAHTWQLSAGHAYEVRPEAGARCDVARIAQIDDARANPLRNASERRLW